MISKIITLLKQPYPLNIEFSKSFLAIVIASVFIPLFLIVFQPLGLNEVDSKGKIWYLLSYGPLTFAFLCFNFYGITKIFPQIFNEENWVVWKESAWILWNIFAGGFVAISVHYSTPFCASTYPELFSALLQAFVVAMIPETVYVLSTYTAFLKNRLKEAESVNAALREKKRRKKAGEIVFTSESGSETVRIPTDELLFIQSIDNYSNIVKHEKTGVKKLLLRSSLKKLEAQIEAPFIVRCHRSYIVNLLQVNAVNGNARGYKLYLNGFASPIPVARDASKEILKILTQLGEDRSEYSRQSA